MLHNNPDKKRVH